MLFYTDNAPELIQAGKTLLWAHDKSQPEDPQSNGLVERQQRLVLEGTRTVLLSAGLVHTWWPWASQYFCWARNILPTFEDGTSPYERRFKHGPFKGLIIPFGHLIKFLPGKRLSLQLGQYEPRSVPGLFIGWKLHNGCSWSKSYYVARLTDFDADKATTRRIHVHTTKRLYYDPKTPRYPLREALERTRTTVARPNLTNQIVELAPCDDDQDDSAASGRSIRPLAFFGFQIIVARTRRFRR